MSNSCDQGACGSCSLAGGCGDPMLTPAQWAAQQGFTIIDPDGWRTPGSPGFDEPIGYVEFYRRACQSTIMLGPAPDADEPFADPNEPQGGCCGGGCG